MKLRELARGQREPELLLFDHDSVSAVLIEACLSSVGGKLCAATSEAECQAALARNAPTLVVLEATPAGYSVLADIKQTEEHKHIPCLLLTSALDRDARLRALQAGADDIFERPIDVPLFVARIKGLLAQTALMQSHAGSVSEIGHSEIGEQYAFLLFESQVALTAVLEEYASQAEAVAAGGGVPSALERARRAQHVLRDLEVIFKLESGNLAPRSDSVPVTSIVRALLARRRQTAAALHVTLTSQGETDRFARADADLVTRVLENLLDLALRRTPARGKTLVEVRDHTQELAPVIEILISSSGTALMPAEREALFDIKTYRSDRVARPTRGSSQGLGLYFCSLVLRAMGGSVEITNSAEYPLVIRVVLAAR